MNQITKGMTQYIKEHPKLKYIFFGGKGGVGKTVMAGTAALWAAKQGKKTLPGQTAKAKKPRLISGAWITRLLAL